MKKRTTLKEFEEFLNSGKMRFRDVEGLPYRPHRDTLYNREDLFGGFDPGKPGSYKETADWKIYKHFQDTGRHEPHSELETLARRLHDYSITEALRKFLREFGHPCRVVAIMGGHSLSRDSSDYKKTAMISRLLTQSGYLMISGGGPGAMEATHLGARFAGYDEKELDPALEILSAASSYKDELWLHKAFEVMDAFPIKPYNDVPIRSLGIPTWHYGHEPPTPFATNIAKYFANSVREEGLLAIAKGGVVYTPGNAGTIQEIFQDACQNRYKTYDLASPMVFLNRHYWEKEKPVYPLLKQLAHGHDYGDLISISDDVETVVKTIQSFPSDL